MKGVYKIENLINGNKYIGLSSNIKNRWNAHKSVANSPNSREYNYPLYRAIRKYGIENFSFEVIEEMELSDVTYDSLLAREVYWIEFYDSFKKGYNQTSGGDILNLSSAGENHPRHKLTEADVIDIRTRWAACEESVREIYIDYIQKIAKTGFKKIYSWQTWKDILPELFTLENRTFHRKNPKSFSNHGSLNGRAKLNEELVREIRLKKKDGVSLDEIYEEYSYIGITKDSFANV